MSKKLIIGLIGSGLLYSLNVQAFDSSGTFYMSQNASSQRLPEPKYPQYSQKLVMTRRKKLFFEMKKTYLDNKDDNIDSYKLSPSHYRNIERRNHYSIQENKKQKGSFSKSKRFTQKTKGIESRLHAINKAKHPTLFQ